VNGPTRKVGVSGSSWSMMLICAATLFLFIGKKRRFYLS